MRTARAKGLAPRRVLGRHVLRNSLIPIVSLFGLDFAAVLGGGAILTETVFDLKGVGWYAAQSVGGLDLPPIMGVTLYGAFFIVVFSAAVDFAYAYLDPEDPADVMAERLLEVKDLKVRFATEDGIVHAVDGVDFELDARQGARDRRRVGLRQERHRDDAARADARTRTPASRARSATRARTCSTLPESRLRDVRGSADRDDLPGPDDVAEPGLHGRRPDRRGDHHARADRARRTREAPRGRAAAPGRDPERPVARRRLPAPVLGRHAPARDDRDGALLQPGHPDRRRADDGARRDDPGADPRAARPACAPTSTRP